MDVLLLASEAHPLIKTGGLGDVAGALPAALRKIGVDARLMIPAFPRPLAIAQNKQRPLPLGDPLGVGLTRLIPATLPGCETPVYLVDCPALFGREGNPYVDPHGHDWPDNGLRFALLSKAAAMCCSVNSPLNWRPKVLHASDWQTGLASAYLNYENGPRPATVFTIHNIQFQGMFPKTMVSQARLPPETFSLDGLEFYGQVSYLKAGLFYSDAITTVSPTYAEEILTPEGGWGMDGLLRARRSRLSGILNGVDYDAWNPGADSWLAAPFGPDNLDGKIKNKAYLQQEMGLEVDAGAPLLGVVSRLTEQKGLDLLPPIIDALLAEGCQLVVLGSGEEDMEHDFTQAAQEYPGKIAVHIGYDEGLSHRVQAGSDMFLMPSRREPCGLTQLYALRYGALPVVRATGGLADTVIDMNAGSKGTGFSFSGLTPEDLLSTIRRALDLYRQHRKWTAAQKRAMEQVFTWEKAARSYLDLYQTLA